MIPQVAGTYPDYKANTSDTDSISVTKDQQSKDQLREERRATKRATKVDTTTLETALAKQREDLQKSSADKLAAEVHRLEEQMEAKLEARMRTLQQRVTDGLQAQAQPTRPIMNTIMNTNEAQTRHPTLDETNNRALAERIERNRTHSISSNTNKTKESISSKHKPSHIRKYIAVQLSNSCYPEGGTIQTIMEVTTDRLSSRNILITTTDTTRTQSIPTRRTLAANFISESIAKALGVHTISTEDYLNNTEATDPGIHRTATLLNDTGPARTTSIIGVTIDIITAISGRRDAIRSPHTGTLPTTLDLDEEFYIIPDGNDTAGIFYNPKYNLREQYYRPATPGYIEQGKITRKPRDYDNGDTERIYTPTLTEDAIERIYDNLDRQIRSAKELTALAKTRSRANRSPRK